MSATDDKKERKLKTMNRNKIKVILKKYPVILRHLQFFYSIVKHKERLMQKKSYGDLNGDKTIFVIRPNAEDGVQGLMSLFIQTIRWIDYAKKKNYVPYVDFKNYKTQYFDGENNIWEYYFTQPSKLEYDEVYASRNVILSGVTWSENVNDDLLREEIFFSKKLCKYCTELIWDNIKLNNEVKEIVARENYFIKAENCLGLYLRGTDYIKMKPTGEYIQPDIEDVINKVDVFIEKHPQINIFLVTEDGTYYSRLKTLYGDRIKIVSFDTFINNYDGKNFLSKSGVLETNKKKRGMDYLVKLILLSKCKYLISSITMGSIAAYSLNGGIYEDEYIFDLGYYK